MIKIKRQSKKSFRPNIATPGGSIGGCLPADSKSEFEGQAWWFITCNPSYLGGRDREGCSSRTAQAKSS
jgi:hypothetical protein